MMSIMNRVTCLAVFLNALHFGLLQYDIIEICESQAPDLAICFTCLQSATCAELPEATGPLCPRNQVCSMVSGDYHEYCTDEGNLTSSPVNDICTCKETGCYVDPYNTDYHVNCAIVGTAISIPPCEVGVFDLDECRCDVEKECPVCGSVQSEYGFCQKSFIFCAGSEPIVMECTGEDCYYPPDCACKTVQEVCPQCGFAPVPNDTSSYIYCQDGDAVLLHCSPGFIYDDQSCMCISTEGLTTSVGPVEACMSCGLMQGEPSDCTEYYMCDPATGEVMNGPFFCAVGLCFEPETCSCS